MHRIALAALLLTACSKEATPASSDASAHAATSASPTPQSTASPSADSAKATGKTRDVKAFIKLGLPSPDHKWGAKDYQAASKVLNDLSTSDPGSLPKHGDPATGAIFARIIDDSNFAMLAQRDTSIKARLPAAFGSMEGVNAILKTYLGAFLKGEVGGREVIELVGTTLRLTAHVLDLAEEFVPTLDKKASDYAKRMQGLAQVKSGAARVVLGALDSVTEKKTYPAAERKRLMGYLLATAARIAPRLSSNSQLELQVRLQKMQQDDSIAELHPTIKALSLKLDKK